MTSMTRTNSTILAWLGVAAVCVAPATPVLAQPGPGQITASFSDPARPGLLQVSLTLGSITITGTNRSDVLIDVTPGTEAVGRPDDDAAAGLRRLTPPVGFSVEEEDNVMRVGARPYPGTVFEIEVPASTNLRLTTTMGDIGVEGVDGDLEVNAVNGGVTLTAVAGSVVAHSVNGRVLVTLTRVTPDQPMAFTSVNGAIDVTLPATVQANLTLRSHRGDVFTDFDLQLTSSPTAVETSRPGRGQVRAVGNTVITGTVNGGGPDIEMRTVNGSVYVRKGP